jgi:uncharacterized protein YkwD
MMNEEVDRGLRTATFLAAVIAMAIGCGGLAGANRRSPGVISDGNFKPAANYPPEPSYGPDPKLTCPSGGVNGAIEDLLKRQDLKGKKVVADGRLCAFADTLLGYPLNDNEPPPESLRAFLSAYFGLPVTLQPRSFISQDIDIDMKKLDDIGEVMMGPLVSFAQTAKSPRYGFIAERMGTTGKSVRDTVGNDAASAGRTRVRLVMYDEEVVLDPLPRSLPAGGTATISGHAEGDVKKLKVQVVDPVGKLTTTEGKGNAFSAPIACGGHSGKMLVQITADTDSGETRLANLPIVCGGELATSVPMAGKAAAGPVDPAAGEKFVAQTINTDRTGASLKPLNVSAPLSEIARSLAERQAAGKSVSSADLTQMLQEKEVTAASISESGARAVSVEDAYQQMANNPTDRASQMSPDVTDIGVGVAKGPEVAGKPSAVVVMLYVKQSPPADPAAAKTKLYEAIDQKRAEAKAETVKKDDMLDSVAQKYADAAAKTASGQVPKDQESEIMAPLYKGSMVVNQMGGWTRDETSAVALADQGTALGKGKLIGVGVASGKSVQFGKNSLFVVVLVGTKHDAAGKPARKAPAKKH